MDHCSDETSASAFVTGFVASTIAEVRMLAVSGLGFPFNDILFGVPIGSCRSKLALLDQIQQQRPGVIIHVLVDHPDQVKMLEEYYCTNANSESRQRCSVFLKLDTGYHRAGISCDDRGVDLASRIVLSKQLNLKGVYSHWYVPNTKHYCIVLLLMYGPS